MARRVMFQFGPFNLPASQVFLETPLAYASVNIRPVVPGHALIMPRRPVARVRDLTSHELTEMWQCAQRVAVMLEQKHQASSSTFTIQDGPDAGQSVAHVHIHVLPRRPGDFPINDHIYHAIEASAAQTLQLLNQTPKSRSVDGDERTKRRTEEEMSREADENRALLAQMAKL
jgi:bis(5'-adenosyl)-triphosphatase